MSFPKYPEYKDSGVEWLGEVPAHWRLDRSDAYIDSMAETVPAERLSDKEVFHYSIPVVQETGDGRYEDGGEIESSKLLVSQSQVLVSKLNPRKGTVCLAAPQDVVTVCSGEFVPLTSKSLDLDFLLYLVRTANYRFRLESMVESATRSHQRASPSDIAKFRWAFPPEGEQAKIADFLDHETARIDALVEEQQRLIELLKEKRQAVISHAVTKGLDPDVPMKDSGVEWLGEVPAHWVRKRLKNVSPLITVGIVVNPSSYLAEEGLPFIYGGEVREGYIEVDKARKISVEDSRRNRKTMLEAGDVVTMRVGYPGVTSVVPPECEGGNCASVMLIKKGGYDSRWLCALMNSRLIRHQVEVVQYGAAQKQFNIADAVEFWLFEPPLDEQASIADYIDDESSRFDQLVDEAILNMDLLKERRSALISAAVTGKIDVRGWQPPAGSMSTTKTIKTEVV